MRTTIASLLLLPAAALAQTPPNLIGVTLNAPLLHQSVHGSCTQLGNCPLGLPAATLFYWPGGTAFDGGSDSVWVTTGQLLGRYSPGTCAPNCGPIACPKSSAIAEATGLDLYDAGNELWTIDSQGWITRSQNNCALGFVNAHNTGLSLSGFTATTGITIDELRGLVFYSTADFSVGSGTIYVAPLSNPGAWYQTTPVSDCAANPTLITGLAVDAGNSVLYWTNGRGTFAWSYTVAGPTVTFTPGTCCIQATPFPDPYTDLSIRWGGATSTGLPCANGTCPACPMQHLLRNAPLLGTTLQLGLDQAPVGVPIWDFISIGSCTAGITAPPACGLILVPLNSATIPLGFQITTGGTGCTGTTTFLLPLPANPALVGLPMASQCLGLCLPTGTTLSNCLSFVLQ